MISWDNPWSDSANFLMRLRALPIYILWSMAGFTSGWVQTRRLRNLFFGIPALACAMLVVSLTVRSREGLKSDTIQRYTETAQLLLKNNQLDQADFYLNRLKSLPFQTDSILAARAEIASRRERPDLAQIHFHQMLENTDHTQDSLAHQQLAIFELQATRDPNSAGAAEAIRHLQLALEDNPNNLKCHELLAKLFMTRGDLNSVAQHLLPMSIQNPAVQIDLARVYEQLGRQSKKEECAAKAEQFYSAAVARIEALQSGGEKITAEQAMQWNTGCLNWSESLIMQGQLDAAAQVVTRALDRQNTPELRRRLAMIYVRLANELTQEEESWRKRWELVTLSRTYDPDAKESLVILANIAAHAPFELRQLAQKEIQPFLDNSQAPAAVFFLMGTAAAQNSEWESALKLLRQSVTLEPRADIVWNNLAYTLHTMPNPDWEEAERCVNEAIRLNPTPAIYHETRGQIMVGQQRWAEAVHELERALQEIPAQSRIHRGLSVAYLQLGDEDLASFHQIRQTALSNQ